MCRDEPCPDQNKKRRQIWGMKTLKMCFGKGHLKQRELIEQGIPKYIMYSIIIYLYLDL